MPQQEPQRNDDRQSDTYSGVPRIRTYASDMAHAVRKGQGSVLRHAVSEQEQKKQNTKEASKQSRRKTIFLVFSILTIFIAGIIIALSQLVFTPATKPVTQAPTIPAHLRVDEQSGVAITDKAPQEVLGEVQSTVDSYQGPTPGVMHVYLTKALPEGESQLVGIQEFFSLFETTMSAFVGNTLQPQFTYGAVITDETAEYFLVMEARDHDDAFEGLRLWEETMAEDIDTVLHLNLPPETLESIDENSYSATTLNNTQTRYAANATGDPAFFYQFLRRGLVVFAPSPGTLRLINERYVAKQLER